jgi:hypothetical protein
MNDLRQMQSYGPPDEHGIIRNGFGDPAYRGANGTIFKFYDEANRRYCKLLAQSPFSRRPHFVGPVIEDGVLILESSGRRVVVEDDTWPALADALLRIHFEYCPPKVPRPSASVG